MGPSLSFSSFARLRLSYQLAHSCGWWRFHRWFAFLITKFLTVRRAGYRRDRIRYYSMYVCTCVHVPRDSITPGVDISFFIFGVPYRPSLFSSFLSRLVRFTLVVWKKWLSTGEQYLAGQSLELFDYDSYRHKQAEIHFIHWIFVSFTTHVQFTFINTAFRILLRFCNF